MVRLIRLARLVMPLLLLALGLGSAASAQAAMFKCVDRNGKTVYSDSPCDGNANAAPWKPKREITVMGRDSFVGRKSSDPPTDKRPSWLKPLDPIGDCKAKGGKFDPEMRACMIP